jgi:hypothetical protein
MGFNATFNSISAISWRRKPERTADLGQVTDKPYRVRLHTFCCLQSGARTHNPDAIGYSDYTGKPTTLTTRPPRQAPKAFLRTSIDAKRWNEHLIIVHTIYNAIE